MKKVGRRKPQKAGVVVRVSHAAIVEAFDTDTLMDEVRDHMLARMPRRGDVIERWVVLAPWREPIMHHAPAGSTWQDPLSQHETFGVTQWYVTAFIGRRHRR